MKQRMVEQILEQLRDALQKIFNETANGESVTVSSVEINGIRFPCLSIRISGTLFMNLNPGIDEEWIEKNYIGTEEEKEEAIMGKAYECALRYLESKSMDINPIIESLKKYEAVKEAILPVLCSPKRMSDERSQNVPHRNFLDLVVTYRINGKYMDEEDHDFTVEITNGLLEEYAIDEITLHDVAMENLKDKLELISMEEVIGSFIPSDVPLMIFRHKGDAYGASAMLCEEFIRQWMIENGERFVYILPSSTEECLLLPNVAGNRQGITELLEKIQEVNRECVQPNEYLSDSLYYYDLEEGYGAYSF